MAKRKKLNPSGPDPDCKGCGGKGAYPPEEMAGMYVVIRTGKSKNAIPCKECKKSTTNKP